MVDLATIRNEVDAAGRVWRTNATHDVLIVLAIFGLPLIVCIRSKSKLRNKIKKTST